MSQTSNAVFYIKECLIWTYISRSGITNHLSTLIISYGLIWPQGSRDIAMCDLEQIALFFLPLITHFYRDHSHTFSGLRLPFLPWHLCYKLSNFGVNSSYSSRDNLTISPPHFQTIFICITSLFSPNPF